jgi:glycine/D-amino acid oxidase-like deaminating enzyme
MWLSDANDGCTANALFEHDTTQELKSLLAQQGETCDLDLRGSVQLESQYVRELLSAPVAPARKRGHEGEIWLHDRCQKEFGSAAFTRALVSPKAGAVHPAKLVWSLAKLARKRGVNFQPFSPVTALDSLANGACVVRTSRGNVRCKRVAVCTNAYTSQLLPQMFDLVKPVQNQVLATLPIGKRYSRAGLSVGGGAAQIYGIQRPTGELVIGGARSRAPGEAVGVLGDVLDERVSWTLRRFAQDCLGLRPSLIAAEWTGPIAYTPDKKPLVGRLAPGVWIAAGFCGHGMTRCFGAGKLVACQMERVDFPSEVFRTMANLWSPSRFARKGPRSKL